jgi:transcriptional regulator with XRE-family HTH domain
MNILKKRIKQIREAKNMTQKELAEKSGISCNTICALEGGNAQTTTTKTLAALALALGTTVDNLFSRRQEALYELSDVIFALKRDADAAHLMANQIFEDHYTGDPPVTMTDMIIYADNYRKAELQLKILSDYTFALKKTISALDDEATNI